MRKVLFFAGKITHRILLVSIPAILLTLLLLELFSVYVLRASDVPDVMYDRFLGNLYVPNQNGRYIKGKKGEINAFYRINNIGWNSPHDYTTEKKQNIFRIAVIGDSYVEAFQVDYDKSFPYLAEKALEGVSLQGKMPEVYTFGHSGANLAHYARMLEHVAFTYSPNLVIISIVGNDFEESLLEKSRRDNWSVTYKNGHFLDIPPTPQENLYFKRLVRKSAIGRYLVTNLDLVNTSPIVNKVFYAQSRNVLGVSYPDNTDISIPRISLIDDMFSKYLALKNQYGFDLLILIDAERENTYSNVQDKISQEEDWFELTRNTADKLGIPFVELSNVFYSNRVVAEHRFDWSIDEHWNEYAHQLISNEVGTWIKTHYSF